MSKFNPATHPKYAAQSLQSCSSLCNPMDDSPPGSSVTGFSKQEYWSGLPLPSPVYLPYPEVEPESPVSPALAGGFFITSTTIWSAHGTELLSGDS